MTDERREITIEEEEKKSVENMLLRLTALVVVNEENEELAKVGLEKRTRSEICEIAKRAKNLLEGMMQDSLNWEKIDREYTTYVEAVVFGQ